MDSIDFQQILFLLGPGSGTPIWNILLYIIFFLGLISLLLMPDKNLVPTLLMAAVLLFAVVAKLSLSVSRGQQPILRPAEFGMLVINVGMFALPLLAGGLIRARKSKATVPAILTGIFGGVYFFMFWFFVQRPIG